MDEAQRKEQFSSAYLRLVATVAGFTMARPEVDDDSIDWIIMAHGGEFVSRPRLEVQLKCTSQELNRGGALQFALNRKNYDDLRADSLVPRLLVVMRVPEDTASWLETSSEVNLVRYCAYWRSLAGLPPLDNRFRVTISLSQD